MSYQMLYIYIKSLSILFPLLFFFRVWPCCWSSNVWVFPILEYFQLLLLQLLLLIICFSSNINTGDLWFSSLPSITFCHNTLFYFVHRLCYYLKLQFLFVTLLIRQEVANSWYKTPLNFSFKLLMMEKQHNTKALGTGRRQMTFHLSFVAICLYDFGTVIWFF